MTPLWRVLLSLINLTPSSKIAPVGRLRIEKVVHGGFGLGREEGRVWLVPYTAPGDLIEAEPVQRHATYIEGVCKEVVEAGPDRVEPRCPLFGRCGGCHLQHLSSKAQVAARREILLESARRLGRIEGLEPKVICGKEWEYRARLEFHVGASRIGFFARNSHDLVPVEDCPIALPAIRRLIPDLSLAIAEAKVTGPANIEVVVGADHEVVFVCDGPPGWFTPALPSLLMSLPGVQGILLHTRGRHWISMGRTEVTWVVPGPGGRKLCADLDPRGFTQANIHLNACLVEEVLNLADVRAAEEVLELYAGAGNFTLPLLALDQRPSVTAVEVQRLALAALERAARAYRVNHMRLTTLPGKTEAMLRRLLEQHKRYDLVLADPPRAGIGQATRLLPRFGPLRIVLVSCEPTTLARDTAVLIEAGYRPATLVLVDMFPQTAHVEAVLRLVVEPVSGRG